jgi:hypothetical protein
MNASTGERAQGALEKTRQCPQRKDETLASKDYAGQFPVTPDVTVLF